MAEPDTLSDAAQPDTIEDWASVLNDLETTITTMQAHGINPPLITPHMLLLVEGLDLLDDTNATLDAWEAFGARLHGVNVALEMQIDAAQAARAIRQEVAS